MSPDHVAEIRAALSDPHRVCSKLGLSKDSQRQAGGLLIRCPAHKERTPSCSVTRGPDGTIRVRCFGCDFTGDVLTLIAVAHGLDARAQFHDVLLTAAELGGLWQVADELRGGEVSVERPELVPVEPTPEREYPDASELEALWSGAGRILDDPEACSLLEARAISPVEASSRRLARVLMPGTTLPAWARYRGATWADTGHRLLVRMWDASGVVRSVRAWRVTEGDSPKRLPPGGCRASGLVLANVEAWKVLRGNGAAELVISEGEPDWLTWATRWNGPVLGIVSGSWTPELAAKIASVERVIVRTDHDAAGDRYAEEIFKSLKGKCELWRSAA